MTTAETVAIVMSFIGALAWLPWIVDIIAKPKLKCRLISHFENFGSYNGQPGTLYFVALNVISLRKPFHIRDTRVSVDGRAGNLYWARFSKWCGPNNEALTLLINPEDTLPFAGTIPQDITKTIYMTFKVDGPESKPFGQIDIVLIAHSGNQETITIRNKEINGDQILWDDQIWVTNSKG